MTVGRAAFSTAVVALWGCIVWGFWLEPASLRVETVDMPVAWPYSRPLRVAVVSDLHVGSPYQTLAHLDEIVDRINATQPDMVCLLGDFVTRGVLGGKFVPPQPIAARLGRLTAPAGVFAVLGNHDNWTPGAGVDRALIAVGIRVLEDSAIRVVTPSGPVWVAGVGDFWTAPHNVPHTLAFVSDSTPVIVLAHNPDIFPRVPGSVMLTLAAHTHGGQIRLPIVGALVTASIYGQRFVGGRVRENGREMFISTGIGTSGIPVRFGVPPTIFLLVVEPPAGAGKLAFRRH